MNQSLRLTAAEQLGEARFAVTFSNGRSGTADLTPLLKGPMFNTLLDPERLRCFELDPELGTITWPNGADLAPEAIYFQAFRNDPALQDTFQRWGYLESPTAPVGNQR
jgi:hypothetical protein